MMRLDEGIPGLDSMGNSSGYTDNDPLRELGLYFAKLFSEEEMRLPHVPHAHLEECRRRPEKKKKGGPHVPYSKKSHPQQLLLLANPLPCSKDKSRKPRNSLMDFYQSQKEGLPSIPQVRIPRNPSSFAVFAAIRSTCLENQHRESTLLQLQNSSAWKEALNADENSETEGESPSIPEKSLPKVVGIGIGSVLEIIRESLTESPSLCQKALGSLLNILQGLEPEELTKEPSDIMELLFETLMKLSSSYEENEISKSISSMACACLLSFVVAYGDTGKILRATSSLLMSPQAFREQRIPVPSILVALQKSIISVMMGRTHHPDLMSSGLPKASLIDSFSIHDTNHEDFPDVKRVTSDGLYLYAFTDSGLFKIGSGYSGTIKGHIYKRKSIHLSTKTVRWIGFADDAIFIEVKGEKRLELLRLNKDTFLTEKTYPQPNILMENKQPYVLFCDGSSLGILTLSMKDKFLLKFINPSDLSVIHELPLKLAYKRVGVLGASFFEEGVTNHEIDFGSIEEENISVQTGKDFGLLLTSQGKVFYTGKSSSLGFKHICAPGEWSELCIPKNPRIVDIAIGHDGQHACLLTDDGNVFFTGTARRGEDGEQTKARRQPKPVKPKKISRMEGHIVVQVACNNGTSAFVTKEGKLFLFGKDSIHCDYSSGQVLDLKGNFITQVAVGKAHIVALTKEGDVFTFGMNSKGQCGRDFNLTKDNTNVPIGDVEKPTDSTAAQFDVIEDNSDVDGEHEGFGICPAGKHNWKRDQCMVCTICLECTGYGPVCVSSARPDRNPGMQCGCGFGDSGCSECGCCRFCTGETGDTLNDAEAGASGAAGGAEAINAENNEGSADMLHRHLIRLDLIAAGQGGSGIAGQSGDYREKIIRRTFPKRHVVGSRNHRSRRYSSLSNNGGAEKSSKRQNQVDVWKAFNSELNEAAIGEKDADPVNNSAVGGASSTNTKLTSLPPAKVFLPDGIKITKISSGHHHTIMLASNGDVYTFGNNFHGQLGVCDLLPRGSPTKVNIPTKATSVVAGSYHSLILTEEGEIFSFGMYQRGQLGREEPPSEDKSLETREELAAKHLWFAISGLLPRVGPRHGRIATWIGASADQSFIKVDESLINAQSLVGSSIVSSRKHIVLVPPSNNSTSFTGLVINKSDGYCRSFDGPEQADLSSMKITIDPCFNVLWAFSKESVVHSYHPLSALSLISNSSSPNILSPELALPSVNGCMISRNQVSLNMLSCLDTLTQYPILTTSPISEEESVVKGSGGGSHKTYSKEDYNVVNRFDSFGGGWGYSGHSIEAIRFMVDTDILIGGLGLFGGRGEYVGKIRIFDIGFEGGDLEIDGEIIAESEEVTYECTSRQKYPLLFEEPVNIQAGKWYIAWARITGPSSDCGSSGQIQITTEEQIQFHFKSSKKSNNGTDVNAGQIPQILYRVLMSESPSGGKRHLSSEPPEPVCVLSLRFSKSVTPDCFSALLSLLRWSWSSFKSEMNLLINNDGKPMIMELQRLIFICRAALRLIIIYTDAVYPVKVLSKISYDPINDTAKLAETIYEVRMLLQQLLTDPSPVPSAIKDLKGTLLTNCEQMTELILKDANRAYVACFHAFFPTGYLKWTSLCNLLTLMESSTSLSGRGTSSSCNAKYDRLLTAVLDALCNPLIKLRNTFPITYSPDSDTRCKNLSPTENLSLTTSMIQAGDTSVQRFPVLTETMNYLSHGENLRYGSWSFREVLDRLLNIGSLSIKQNLHGEPQSFSPELVEKACKVISSVISELTNQSTSSEPDIHSIGGRILHATPNRFTRTGISKTWNTGNGSPDAICFSVDKSGIFIAGCCVYGGTGTYDYQLELLDDQSNSDHRSNNVASENGQSQRWNSLEVVNGSYSSDDCVNDIAELKFDRAVPIRPHLKYALRLRNHGGRTSNGDGGMSSVRGPDGTTFSFNSCSLSFNGSNPTRGQLPQILYYSSPQETDIQSNTTKNLAEKYARRTALTMTSAIVKTVTNLLSSVRSDDLESFDVLNRAPLITNLMPHILASVSSLAALDPHSAVSILAFIQDMLPPVATLNNIATSLSGVGTSEGFTSISSNVPHYAYVESSHPYKASTVYHYRVHFPKGVRWLSVEFDSRCSTSQPEDYLQIYIRNPSCGKKVNCNSPRGFVSQTNSSFQESQKYTPVLRPFHGPSENWPNHAIILPGNEVLFSLETASDYVKEDKNSNQFGFRCLVVGYEGETSSNDGLKNLEKELSYLGGVCVKSLMKRNVSFSQVEDMELVDESAGESYEMHYSLLSKGLALSHPPTINEALDGVIPYSNNTHDRLFLKNFVNCIPNTAGGRLARWLQPESYVDVNQCRVFFAKEDMRCNWPNIITVVTQDQYGEVVWAPAMKVEVRAVPIEYGLTGQKRLRRAVASEPDAMSFGGIRPPNLDTKYEITVKDKMFYHSITVQKCYDMYSFEELRFASPAIRRQSENMLVRPNNDGTYSANWTPGNVGWYQIHVSIDGAEIQEVYKVEVYDPPQGLLPPPVSSNGSMVNCDMSNGSLTPSQSMKNGSKGINSSELGKGNCRLRKFIDSSSAGLRIRVHPTLQSEQIGIIPVDGSVSIIDELQNSDGHWVRLSIDSLLNFCKGSNQNEGWCLQYNQHLHKVLMVLVTEKEDLSSKKTSLSHPLKPCRKKRSAWKCPGVYTVVKCGAACHNIRNSPSLSASPIGMLNQGDSVNVINSRESGNEIWVQLDKSSMEKFCLNTEGEAWSLAVSSSDVQHLEHQSNCLDDEEEDEDEDETVELEIDEGGKIGGKHNSNGSKIPQLSDTRRKKKKRVSSSMEELKGINHHLSKNEKPKPLPRVGLSSERRTPSPSNSKPSFFQKWFKGDQVNRRTSSLSPPSHRKVTPSQFVNKDIPPELQGVSVRELVKVIGESRANGNGVTPPGTPNSQRKRLSNTSSCSSRSCSPASVKSVNEIRIPKQFESNEEKSKKQLAAPSSSSVEDSKITTNTTSDNFKVPDGPVKEALSPSVAESIRTVFAAFVWHENIIHDTIAAASFLKFHPNLNKADDIIKTGKVALDPSTSSGRAFRKKWTENAKSHRHSMDVSSSAYQHHVSQNSNVAWNNANENSTTKQQEEEKLKKEVHKSKGNLCPPTLKLLAVLWEEIRSYCIHAILQQVIVSSNPLHHTQLSSNRVAKQTLLEKRSKTKARIKNSLKSKEQQPPVEPGKLCEMCDQYFGNPVTYHMRLEHPGCGSHAGGKGYNSGGNYCKGWAGNCGDGGVGGSSWYLICSNCRDNYKKISSQQIPPPPPPSGSDSNDPPPIPPVKPSKSLPPSSSSLPIKSRSSSKRSKITTSSSSNTLHSSGINSHIIMKNNATFLLDLSSSSNNNESAKMSSSSAFLYSVSELTTMDPNPFPITPFQCFNSLCVKESVLRDMNDEFYLDKDSFKSNSAQPPNIGYPLPSSDAGESKAEIKHLNNNNDDVDESANNGGVRCSLEETVSPPEGFQSDENDAPNSLKHSNVSSSPIRFRNSSHTDKDNRKRNSSCEEQIHHKKDDDFFLSHPSHDLQKLFTNSNGGYVVSDILQRPVMSFVLQWNDLDSLQLSMANSIRKASCRTYAIQALNWLLRSVSQPDCLHDLLWFFVASLENSQVEANNSNNDHYVRKQRRQNQQKLMANGQQFPLNENVAQMNNYFTPQFSGLNEHPSSDIVTGGEAIQPLPSTLYSLLQTISDLMLLLPLGSPLLQIAVTCWAIKFKPSDHQFLHQSHVFSSISKILSRSEEFDTNVIVNNPLVVEKSLDSTSYIEIKTSSRVSMITSLSDNSTETFWESGDEDRNKIKWISLTVGDVKRGHVCAHIDNCRDLVSKVSGITFKLGAREEDLIVIKQVDVENRFAGWVSCYFDDVMCVGRNVSLLKIEFKGPDSTLRVRQIKLLSVGSQSICDDKDIDSLIKQQNCESETLRVFRLMTAQVFGKFLRQDNSMDDSEEDLDLREHVVGILFNSKTRLSYLQKQVCSHIVQAIKKEASILKEDWELSLCHHGEIPSLSDTYCFEMLSLVLALSGSTVGKLYLSQQQGLIQDLLNLLHTGTARIQRQVILLIRRILPEIPPSSFASIIGVKNLPPKDFASLSLSHTFDHKAPGLLDIFFSCIAKALTVQVKSKGMHGKDSGGRNISVVTLASSIHPKDYKNVGSRWWLRGSMAKRISEEIVSLLKDLMNGKVGSSEWMSFTKSAVAQNILHLTKLDRTNECLKLPVFWLGLASICVLDKDHVEGLSSGDCNNETSINRPTCENHDDGETLAIIKCETCGDLCGDCDRFLHLHRRTKTHNRAIFKEEEDAIKVDLHEGCGRMKLYWLMALADSTTLKAMVEFREAARGGSSGIKNTFGGSTCRFCGVHSSSEVPVMDAVCTDSECVSFAANACVKTLSCGHFCGGILNEEDCLTCLHGCSKVGNALKQDADDMCMICFTEALNPIPSIMLQCGHVFHYHCCLTVLTKKWNGPRITFGFRNCPICKMKIQHPSLRKILIPLQNLYEDVKRKSLMRLEYESLNNCEAVTAKGGRYHNDPISYALDRYAYYVCFKCSKAYYGGEAQCDGAVGDDKFNPEELVCGGCSDVSRAQMCLKHGMDYLEYKCRYCCSVAVFFCFGTTHFCNACHEDFQRLISVPQKDLPQCPVGPKALKLEGEECPLHIKHPSTGEEFALGCGICRNPHTF
uniref:RCR-type E3 ubiquitin transferase n=1 Tax=Lepeophtheirus salmonis TaxID=72036 RepID=A0A0K2UH48_LEPSM